MFFYENGVHSPSPARLERLAAALGCEVGALTGTVRGQESLVDLRYSAGLTLDRVAQRLRPSSAERALRISAAKLGALESHGPCLAGAGRPRSHRPPARATGPDLRRAGAGMVLDAWMRTRPADPPPVPPQPSRAIPAARTLADWESLNERQQVYLGEIMRDERMTETEMWMRRVEHLAVPKARSGGGCRWRWDAPVETVGYTRLQERLRRRGVHDPGAGQTIHALERRGLVRVSGGLGGTRGSRPSRSGPGGDHAAGEWAARAGLGEPREIRPPEHLLSEWLWGVLARVAAAEPDGLADDRLAGRSLFFIGVGYRGGVNGPPSRGFVESVPG